ncbi:MAG: hypothetical protein ABSH16_13025, partial [Sedimentisphaerales bacterium]
HKMDWNVVIWKKEFFDRLFGEYAAGHYPWHYYLGMVFKYVSPWCILFPIALVVPFYKAWGQKRPIMQYLWLWFVGDYVFLMLSGGKRQHYLLPLIPAMSIMTAILIDEMAFVRQAFTPKFAANMLRGHVLFFIGFAIIKNTRVCSRNDSAVRNCFFSNIGRNYCNSSNTFCEASSFRRSCGILLQFRGVNGLSLY